MSGEVSALADEVAPGPVTALPALSLALVHRRGHGARYDGLAAGVVDVARLRVALAGLDLRRDSTGRLRLAVDVTPWPRPDAECSPQRLHCHRPCRCDGVRDRSLVTVASLVISGSTEQLVVHLGKAMAGQRLIVTQGVGRTQQWGGPVEEIRAGDVVWCPPGVKHWHGASPTCVMTHIALTGVYDG